MPEHGAEQAGLSLITRAFVSANGLRHRPGAGSAVGISQRKPTVLPQTLDIRCVLNGRIMQKGNTADMIFPVAELIARISQDTTLLPGTLILTGTPPGVGFARKPPIYLSPGDHVRVVIKGIGTLDNPVQDAAQCRSA